MTRLEPSAPPLAIVRAVSDSLPACVRQDGERPAIDVERARQQHASYVACLTTLGLRVEWLAPLPSAPDAVFVEDCAVVVDELAIITNSAIASRASERPSVAAALASHRRVEQLPAAATMDGGDVLRIGRTFYVGLSERTNARAIETMRELLSPHGYDVRSVPVTGCLHLKSAVTALDERAVLANRAWFDASGLDELTIIDVAEQEPGGANVLAVGGAVIASSSFPATAERVRQAGYDVRSVDASEFHEADGALTCMSLILNAG